MKVSYQKSASLFLFVSDLSQWNNLTCLPERRKEWIRITGKLSEKNRKDLEKFSKILQNSKNNLEIVFLFGKNTEGFPKKETEEISEILKFFKERFDLIWEEERKKLKNMVDSFGSETRVIKNYLPIIQRLCGLSKNKISNVNLKLLISGPNEYQGWSYKNTIILECSGWYSFPVEELYLVFLHELFHILFKNNKDLFEIFKNITKLNSKIINSSGIFRKWGAEIVFEEALISSFLPEGYLGQKLYPQDTENKKKDDLSNLRNFCQYELFDLAKDYTESGKMLDEKYFLEIIGSIGRFLKKNGR